LKPKKNVAGGLRLEGKAYSLKQLGHHFLTLTSTLHPPCAITRTLTSYLRVQSQNAVAVILIGKMDLHHLWVRLRWRSWGRFV